ncbi:membrane translocase subunit TIM17 [Seminavis robusta]|uniref:Membrane translocase subunit TIM17 n=1 Tax=Seminavis robusta TaxID=568900 RepID=A0A9N8DWL8_9STRA|nr:membrane translocase subunit TIM17 [Seminavis robusta]|eukprot:Sro414_g138360.1 membrane translocase subunit TIM17 (240) ;mRNA; r:56210-56929
MPRQSGFADREPCPWRIVDDVGGAFCMGAIGGGVWHSVKGARMAPAGARWAGSLSAVQARSPVLGGQFAVWGGLFACCDCTLTSIRQKEDPWNSIVSGAATGGMLAVRAGPRAMASAAAVGGVLLALIEGMGIMFTKMMAPPVPTAQDYEKAMAANDPTAPPTAGGLFPTGGGGFGALLGGPSSDQAPAATTEPPMSEPFMTTDGTTTFSTEASKSDTGNDANSSGGSWWPFSGGSGSS